MTPLRIAVIGGGFMGSMHARVLADLPLAELVTIVEPREESGRRLAGELGCGWAAEPSAVLADPSIAAVVIATPDAQHVDVTVAALDAGKAVLLEKPMAHDLWGAWAIETAAASGRLMVAHLCRFDPRYRRAQAAVAAGDIGETVHVTASRFCGHPGVRAIGSHLCWLMGVHDVDLIQWITGRSIVRVSALAKADCLPDMAFGVDDVVFALLELDNGALAQLAFGWTLPPKAPSGLQVGFRLVGTKGMLDVTDIDDGVLTVTADDARFNDNFFWPALGASSGGSLRAEDTHFVEATLLGRPYAVPVADTRRAVAVNDAILRSLQSGSREAVAHSSVGVAAGSPRAGT